MKVQDGEEILHELVPQDNVRDCFEGAKLRKYWKRAGIERENTRYVGFAGDTTCHSACWAE